MPGDDGGWLLPLVVSSNLVISVATCWNWQVRRFGLRIGVEQLACEKISRRSESGRRAGSVCGRDWLYMDVWVCAAKIVATTVCFFGGMADTHQYVADILW